MKGVSNNPGIWERGYGAAATGLPFAPGQIMIEELKRGEISHVLGIALFEAERVRYSWPANRTDGRAPSTIAYPIREGIRLRLDPAIDVDALRMHPIAKTIARAAQIYGFVVWDQAGSVSLRAENPMRYTTAGLPNPYLQLLGGMPTYRIMEGFPWERMQFLPVDYGRPQ